MTVEIGSLSRAPRNDIRKGTRAIWLIAVSALCEVSLQHVCQPSKQFADNEVRTYERHHRIVMTLSANS